jgi:2-polyprenyl-6-methoxyphenol hydroxylase-like FAD-dependent oxidoreductase
MAATDPILIVGAGPTGLTLACDLLSRGVPCRVVELAAQRGDRSRAIAIWPRALEVLAQVGAADAAIARGIPLGRATVWSRGRPTLRLGFAGLPSRFPFALVLPQFETERVLEERLVALGGSVERGVRCTGVWADESGADVLLEHAHGVEQARAPWVVGCDGAQSVVREAAGITMDLRLEPEGWIAADARLDSPLEPSGVNYFLSGGRVLHVVPVCRRGDELSWRITINIGPVSPRTQEWPFERLAETVAARAAVPVRLRETEWTAGFRVRQGLASSFVAGRVLIAGDAAHVHSPAGAQGINAGLQDVANLGWKLAAVHHGSSPAGLLSSYDDERRPAARAVVAATDRTTHVGTMRNPIAVPVRDALWRLAVRTGLVDRLVAPATAGFSQRHHRSAMSPGRRRRWSARPGPGARLPDLDLDGVRLWDLLPARDFCVLVVGASPDPIAAGLPDHVPVLRIDDPRAVEAVGARPGTTFVVRPDRYIAIRCGYRQATRVAEYFESIRKEIPCPAPARRSITR